MDITGLLLVALVTTAAVQGRDAARLPTGLHMFPDRRSHGADGGYAGRLVTWAPPACA